MYFDNIFSVSAFLLSDSEFNLPRAQKTMRHRVSLVDVGFWSMSECHMARLNGAVDEAGDGLHQ